MKNEERNFRVLGFLVVSQGTWLVQKSRASLIACEWSEAEREKTKFSQVKGVKGSSGKIENIEDNWNKMYGKW